MLDKSESRDRLISWLDRCIAKVEDDLNNTPMGLEDKYCTKGRISALKEIKKVAEEGKFDDILAKDE